MGTVVIITLSSNGKTVDFESTNGGSIPSGVTKMQKYMNKPVYFEAVQWKGDNKSLEELCKLVPEKYRNNRIGQPAPSIITPAGIIDIPWLYWVLRYECGDSFRFKILSPEDFEEGYQKVE